MDNFKASLELKFKFYYKKVREVSSSLLHNYYEPGYIETERIQFAKYWTHEYLKNMYRIICVYLEYIELTNYLENFKREYSDIIKDTELTTEISSILLRYGDTLEDLSLIIEWENYLSPFNLFDSDLHYSDNKLIDFLECTNDIIKITHTEVYKEEDINACIRQTAGFYFNNITSYSEGYFVHQFKNYRPDIIIKELKTAVEFKLIRKNEDIGIKLDELIIDAKRYTGNHNNETCIAVFCLSSKITKTKKEIKEDWNNMKFPKNWNLVIVGNIEIKSSPKNENNK